MSDSPDINANIGLDLSDYQRNIQRAIRQADEFDTALDDLIKSANNAEKQLNELNTAVDVEIDTNMASLLDADRLIQGLDTTISPLVDVQVVNDSAARSLLEDFNATLTPKLDIETSELEQAQQLIARLDAADANVKVNVDDSEVSSVERKIGSVDDTVNVDVVEGDTQALKSIQDQLNTLKSLAVIDIVMQLGDNIPTAEDIPLLATIADQDRAKRVITAGTGDSGKADLYAAGAEDVYTANFGADREEAARGYMEVVRQTKDATGELTTTGENFSKVTQQGFATAAQTGEEFNSVIAAADTLVSTGLAPSYEEAFDMINNGFQEGLNKGNDFLDTIKEYSGQFADLGFSAEEFFTTLKGGLDAGAFNTDFVADLVKEFNIRAQAAMTRGSTEFDAFRAMGLTDELKAFKAGEITGKEFFSGAVQAAMSGDFDPQKIFDVMGTKAEDLTLDAVIKLDPAQINEELANYSGATLEVSAQLGGDLTSSIETARRVIEGELASSISTAFDIPGKIQAFSDGVSKMSELIDLGATIPEAIEVAFELPGFASTADMLASTMGNLGITFMEVAASILDAMGKGDAASGVRDTIVSASEAQLAFDLKLANDGSDFASAVRTATERGVADADIQAAIATAGTELIAQGDMTKAAEFKAALEDLATIELSPELTGYLSGKGIDLTNINAVKDALVAFTETPGDEVGAFGTYSQFADAMVAAKTTLDEIDFATTAQTALLPFNTEFQKAQDAVTGSFEAMRAAAEEKLPGMEEIFTSSIVPVNETVTTLQTGFDSADAAFATLGINFQTNTGVLAATLSTATGDIDSFTGNIQTQFTETAPVALEAAEVKMQEFGVTVLNTMLKAGEDVQGLIDKLLSIGGLDITLPGIGTVGGDGPAGSNAVGGTIEPGGLSRVHAGEQLISGGGEGVAVLNRQTSSIIDSAIAGYMASAGMGGGGGSSITNNYINVTFNNNGGAASVASLDQTKNIRGF